MGGVGWAGLYRVIVEGLGGLGDMFAGRYPLQAASCNTRTLTGINVRPKPQDNLKPQTLYAETRPEPLHPQQQYVQPSTAGSRFHPRDCKEG